MADAGDTITVRMRSGCEIDERSCMDVVLVEATATLLVFEWQYKTYTVPWTSLAYAIEE